MVSEKEIDERIAVADQIAALHDKDLDNSGAEMDLASGIAIAMKLYAVETECATLKDERSALREEITRLEIASNEMLELARAAERERDELRKDIEELRLAFSKAALANAALRIERDAAAQSHRIKPVLMSLTGPSPAALFWADRIDGGKAAICSWVEDEGFAGLVPLPERDRLHIISTLRGTIFDKPETWDDAVDPKPFATSGAEAQFNEHQAHACPLCGGSGHADDVDIASASLQRHAAREAERGAKAAADLERWHEDMRAAMSGFCASGSKWSPRDAMREAVLVADAMTIERRKREGSAT